MIMHAPADRIAKRISLEDWLARYDAIDLLPLFSKRQEEAALAHGDPGRPYRGARLTRRAVPSGGEHRDTLRHD